MKKKIEYIYIWVDYSVILPFLAFLPERVGRYFAKLRGILYFYKRRDWRCFTFGDYGLWDRVFNSYKTMFPKKADKEILDLVKKRFIYQSIEEFEANLVIQNRYHKINVRYEGLEKIESSRDGKNTIFVTGHFGSIYGFNFLDFLKKPFFAMTSDIKQHGQIHPSIINLNIKKYKGLERYMNGGSILTIEKDKKKFIRRIKKDSNSLIVIDLPPANSNEEALWRDFFGQQRGFASGAQKLAQSAGSIIVPFICYYEKGNYVVRFESPEEDPFAFLEKEIRQRPEMWWASDLLVQYPIKKG